MIRLNVTNKTRCPVEAFSPDLPNHCGVNGFIKIQTGKGWFDRYRSISLNCPTLKSKYTLLPNQLGTRLLLNRGSVIKYLNTQVAEQDRLWDFGFIGSSDQQIAAVWNAFFTKV